MKNFQYRIEYALIRLIEIFFFLFPRAVALKIGEWFGLLFSLVLPKRRRLAMANLAVAFPDAGDAQRARILRQMWRSIGRTAVEFIRVTDINRTNFDDYFIVEGRENLDRAMKLGKGLILVTMHFANWEMMAVGTAFLLGRGAAIARPMKNPLVEDWVQRKRMSGGVPIILHRQAVKASLKLLKEKKTLGVLVDQNLYTGGVFVDFFGQPAATTTLPALLHDRTEAPVIIGYCVREGKKFRLIYKAPLKLADIADVEKRILDHTQRISQELESIIRARPENWFWIHNRWKRKQAA